VKRCYLDKGDPLYDSGFFSKLSVHWISNAGETERSLDDAQQPEARMIAPTLQIGQRARITLLADVIGADQDAVQFALAHARRVGSATFLLPTKVIMAAGTTYQGTIIASDEAFIELLLANGDTLSFDIADSRLFIEQM